MLVFDSFVEVFFCQTCGREGMSEGLVETVYPPSKLLQLWRAVSVHWYGSISSPMGLPTHWEFLPDLALHDSCTIGEDFRDGAAFLNPKGIKTLLLADVGVSQSVIVHVPAATPDTSGLDVITKLWDKYSTNGESEGMRRGTSCGAPTFVGGACHAATSMPCGGASKRLRRRGLPSTPTLHAAGFITTAPGSRGGLETTPGGISYSIEEITNETELGTPSTRTMLSLYSNHLGTLTFWLRKSFESSS